MFTAKSNGATAGNDHPAKKLSKVKIDFIRLAWFLMASPETIYIAAVIGFTIGLLLAGLWGH